MKKLNYLLVAFLFALTLPLPAKDAGDASMSMSMSMSSAKAAPYFDAGTFDLKTIEDLLPNPPDAAATKTELDQIEKHPALTPVEIGRIKNEQEHLNVYLFATVLGSWFDKKNVPATNRLFTRVSATTHPITDLAKNHYGRLRPFQQDTNIKPPLTAKELAELSKNPSYPSGHSTVGILSALILAELVPEEKEALMARGLQIGDDRVLAGVHFPSDVAAGHTLAQAFFTKLMANADFQADLAKAKGEIATVRAANAKPTP